MTQRVFENFCAEKVCVDDLIPIVRAGFLAERILRGFLFFGPPDFFADFLAGFFLLLFCVWKSTQKNPPNESPAKSPKNYTTKIPDTFLQKGRANYWWCSICLLLWETQKSVMVWQGGEHGIVGLGPRSSPMGVGTSPPREKQLMTLDGLCLEGLWGNLLAVIPLGTKNHPLYSYSRPSTIRTRKITQRSEGSNF